MGARRLALGATVLALFSVGCGSNKAPAPLKELPATSSTTTGSSAPSAGQTPAANADLPLTQLLAKLGVRERRALAGLPAAEDTLVSRAQAVTDAAAQARQLAERVANGYNPPNGASPEVAGLVDALQAFGGSLRTIATVDTLMPRLSAQLGVRYAQLAKKRPTVAAQLLTAKRQVDGSTAELADLQQQLAQAGAQAKAQESKPTLDADALLTASASATENAASALEKVNAALGTGLTALAAVA